MSQSPSNQRLLPHSGIKSKCFFTIGDFVLVKYLRGLIGTFIVSQNFCHPATKQSNRIFLLLQCLSLTFSMLIPK